MLPAMHPPFRRVAGAAALALALAACAKLLPKSEAEVSSPWKSYEEARAAIESIVPGQTTVEDLKAMGIDPWKSPNLQVLTYSDILLRFPVQESGFARLDAGLRECLEAGKACTGYSLDVRDVKRERVGNFWSDALGFKRVTEVSGWSFNALILMVRDRAVYTLHGGQPTLREHEVSRQPLGPAQDLGDALPKPRIR